MAQSKPVDYICRSSSCTSIGDFSHGIIAMGRVVLSHKPNNAPADQASHGAKPGSYGGPFDGSEPVKTVR
jgi:hypothetical protein